MSTRVAVGGARKVLVEAKAPPHAIEAWDDVIVADVIVADVIVARLIRASFHLGVRAPMTGALILGLLSPVMGFTWARTLGASAGWTGGMFVVIAALTCLLIASLRVLAAIRGTTALPPSAKEEADALDDPPSDLCGDTSEGAGPPHT